MPITSKKTKRGYNGKKAASFFISCFFCALIFICAIFLSDGMARTVARGIALSVRVIIPGILPFLLLGDFCIRFISFDNIGFLRRAFERIFKINGCALSVWIFGILSGFPVGAKLAIEMHCNGKISKCECERLCAISNNASPGYVICAVGLGMFSSLKYGIIIYFIMILSSVISGMIIGRNKSFSANTHYLPRQKYSFVGSVKDAAAVCFNVGAFITVFSIIVGLIDELILSDVVFALIVPFAEIGNAATYLSDLCIFSLPLRLALTAFSISFSGLCVAAQTAGIIGNEAGISIKKYILFKLIQGVIAFSLTLLLFSLIII